MRFLTSAVTVTLLLTHSNQIGQTLIEAAEKARGDAILRRDTRLFDRLTADDLVIIDRTGALRTKLERMDAVAAGDALGAHLGEQNYAVRVFGDLAIVMGRSVWDSRQRRNHDFFTRIWIRRGGRWEMVASHRTDITDKAAATPPAFDMPAAPVPVLPVSSAPSAANAEADVRAAIRTQHAAYWAKDPELYRRYAGADLLRVAETGVRGREELISMMRGNSRLPAPPSDQIDVQVRVFGSTAIGTWIDQGRGLLGNPTQNRFTVVFAHRAEGWQMVHIQSTGIKTS